MIIQRDDDLRIAEAKVLEIKDRTLFA